MAPGKRLILFLLVVVAVVITLMLRQTPNVEVSPLSDSMPLKAATPSVIKVQEIPTETNGAIAPSAEPQQEQDAEKASANHLQLFVQEENGILLDAAKVRIKIKPGEAALTNFNKTFTTDLNGMADVLWPSVKFDELELVVSKESYASRKMIWDLKTGDTIPATFTIKLKRGTQMGGIIVDPEGNPIADAAVSLSRFWSGGDEIQHKGEQAAFSTQKHTTGTDGRWTANELPKELLDHISINATHTNFISAQSRVEDPRTEKELREGTHRMVLTRGLEVRGRVIDEQENAIPSATVWAGRKYFRDRQQTKTDAEGVFTFRNIKKEEEEVFFSVMADGFAPDNKKHKISAGMPEILFRLGKGSMISATVRNESGDPIEGVRVVLEGHSGESTYDAYEFSTKTDAEGKFEWRSAPDEKVPFYFGKPGYQQKRNVFLKPNEENIVTMHSNRVVHGQVLDAQTGEAVKTFKIALGFGSSDRFYASSSHDTKEFTSEQGLFTIEIHEENQSAIQASAKEYAEQDQPLPEAKDKEIQIAFKLKRTGTLEGVVIAPSGRPAAGANVAIKQDELGSSLRFSMRRLRTYGSGRKIATTDDAGRFQLSSPPEDGIVVAASPDGFVSASIAEIKSAGVLKLQPYGRIEGVLIRGTATGAGQEFSLNSPGMFFENSKATADSNGHFTFEDVPPGTIFVSRMVRMSSNSSSFSHATEVTVAPGQTTKVSLGGTDATLQAQVRFESEPTETDYMITAQLRTKISMPSPSMTAEETRALMSSPEWKEQMKTAKHYSAVVGTDGSLVLDSIVPGEYTLRVVAGKSGDGFHDESLGKAEVTLIVPDGTAPGSPIDIGPIILAPVKK